MKIRTKERLVTGMGLAAIGLIAAMIWWTHTEVDDANRQRQQASEIARGMSHLRLVVVEYHLYHNERAKVQWYAVSDRVDRLIASTQVSIPMQDQILDRLRERRTTAQRLFAELTSAEAGSRADAPPDESTRLFEAQLLSRQLAEQQDSFADVFRLTDIATARITVAQQRVRIATLAAIALLAAIIVGVSWFLRRGVLAPIAGLQQATRQVAGGNWDFVLDLRGNDEIGELARNFDSMTQSLQRSFAHIERSNRELATAEERFRVTLESAPTAMVMIDRAGAIVMVNAQAEMLFGYTRNDLLGQAVEVLVPQRFRGGHPAHREGFFARPRSDRMGSDRELYGVRKDGSEFPLEIGLNSITTVDGLFVLSAIVDLTERKQAEDQIKQLNEALVLDAARLERSNQELATLNEELEAFSYSVSHDLRGPLRSMDGFSLALIEDYGDKLDEEGKDALERIRAASQRMGHLIDDLLRLSKVTRAELNVTRVDLFAIAREIADGIDREQSGRAVEWAIEPDLSVRADPALMRIALQNLLQNAWKFTGKTARPVIRVGALERDAKMAYFVADNGVGFDMAHADNLFGAFQRLHDVGDFPGTGIGLAIVQRIIHRHGGEIWAEAKEGEGATFFFTVKEAKNGSVEQDNPAG